MTFPLVNTIVTLFGGNYGDKTPDFTLPAGEHHFPFSFKLPDLPSSFRVSVCAIHRCGSLV
jgi:hypothetical protein